MDGVALGAEFLRVKVEFPVPYASKCMRGARGRKQDTSTERLVSNPVPAVLSLPSLLSALHTHEADRCKLERCALLSELAEPSLAVSVLGTALGSNLDRQPATSAC